MKILEQNVEKLKQILECIEGIELQTKQLMSENMKIAFGEWLWQPQNMNEIVVTFCNHYGAEIINIRGKSRRREYTEPRFMAMALIREKLPEISLNRIAEYFDDRNHSTIISAIQTHKQLIETSDYYRWRFESAKSLTMQKKMMYSESNSLSS